MDVWRGEEGAAFVWLGRGNSFFCVYWWVCRLVKRSLLVDEPAVPCPQNQVQESKKHRRIETAYRWVTLYFTFIFRQTENYKPARICGIFDISQTFPPGGGANQPQEGKDPGHHQIDDGASVRLPVNLLVAQVQDEGEGTVQKTQDANRDEEFSWGWEISLQVSRVLGAIAMINQVWVTRKPRKWKSHVNWGFSIIWVHRTITLISFKAVNMQMV